MLLRALGSPVKINMDPGVRRDDEVGDAPRCIVLAAFATLTLACVIAATTSSAHAAEPAFATSFEPGEAD